MQPINAPSVRNYNNTGTRNNGFQYKLMPLSFNLQQKGNSNLHLSTDERHKFIIGDLVSGICLYDYKEHIGYITQIIYDEKTNNPITVYIIDYQTKLNLPLTYSTLQKTYKAQIYESYNFDKSINKIKNNKNKYNQKNKFNKLRYNKLIQYNIFDDIYDLNNDVNDVIELGDEIYNYNIGDIIYDNKQPYAICCGLKKDFENTFDRFLLLNHIGYDVWSLNYDKINELKNVITDETKLINKNNIIYVDDNGFNNTQILKNNYNLKNFPGFNYCVELGENIYLPSIDELEYLYINLNIINNKLKENNIINLIDINKITRIMSSSQTSKYTNYILDIRTGIVKDIEKDKFTYILPFVKW